MTEDTEKQIVKTGAVVIKSFIGQLPNGPGVYRMLSKTGDVLYVGKAKSLRKRVRSYIQPEKLTFRLQRMVSLTADMEFIHTATEAEALLLESNLIKKFKPQFNILLRDDKSFPYIFLPQDHDYPMIAKHRGARKRKGQYYGPFASAGDVNRTINILQRVFMLRNCTDHVFANRTRPCLQYHIKRCTAPCVDYVSQEEYALQVQDAKGFLDGKSREIQDRLQSKMNRASAEQDYETAAQYRDRLRALASVQTQQDINVEGLESADVMALVQKEGKSCIQVFFFRSGRNYGNRPYFPRHVAEDAPEEILAAFIAQFYENKPVPKELIINQPVAERALLETALSSRLGGRVHIINPSRGAKKRLLNFVVRNAQAALERHLSQKANEEKLLEELANILDLDEPPQRIEVYDNSHISGTNMVGAMIVAGPEGFQKNAYRKFNIKEADAADDFGMMREVLTRRLKKISKQIESQQDYVDQDWPDVILIDGGLGQFNAVKEILEDLGIFETIKLVSIAKGQDRHAGREKLYIDGKPPLQLAENHPVLHYLQRLRDEAHRFAIGTHRARRQRQLSDNPLDAVSGIGARRKKALLQYFGSAKAVEKAAVEDLQKVDGVSKTMAQKIYDHFH